MSHPLASSPQAVPAEATAAAAPPLAGTRCTDAADAAQAAGSPQAPGVARERLRHLLRHAAQVAAANVAITAIVLLLHNGGALGPTLVYTQSIGLSCWALIELGRLALPLDADGAWPRGWRTPALIGAACTGGYVLGTTIADAVLGLSSWPALLASPRDLLAGLLLTAVFCALVAGWFLVRGRAQAHVARLAAVQHEATLAHLALLQSQLEPHMLFNTLANLRALIAVDPVRAQDMLDRLIAFLRATLVASRAGPHALADEIARVEDYLALMQVRMGPRLRVSVTLPRELARAAVPPLLLQPLVENAIKHGLETRRGPGEVQVSAARDGATLVLRVEDGGPLDATCLRDGVGLPRDDAPALSRRADSAAGAAGDTSAPGTGFGLVQVRERLRRLHGDAASLTLAPGRRDGMCAEIRLPLAMELTGSGGGQ